MFNEAARLADARGLVMAASTSRVNVALVRFETGDWDGLESILERAIHTLTLEGSVHGPQAAATVWPLHALPFMRPFWTLRCLTFFGINMSIYSALRPRERSPDSWRNAGPSGIDSPL